MPVFQYEAMDNTGLEVKDTIEAPTEAEATTMIREKGFFVTKISEKNRKKKKKADPKSRKQNKRKLAHSSQSANSGRSVQAGPAEEFARRCD